MFLVNLPAEIRCSGCFEIKAKCCTALGRHRQAQEALEETLRESTYTRTGSASIFVFLYLSKCVQNQ
jgi:anaphase-promoting complex subunit 3